MRIWSYDECKAELRYLESVNPTVPGPVYNYQCRVFAEYCNMIANAIRHSGFPLLAKDAAQIRDIAHPTYRNEARAAGKTVDGVFVPFTREIAR